MKYQSNDYKREIQFYFITYLDISSINIICDAAQAELPEIMGHLVRYNVPFEILDMFFIINA